jgi:chromosome segregation ATPase
MLPVLLLLLLAAAAPAGAQDADANPLNKVLQLLGEFQLRLVKEGEDADKAYREYFDWCDDSANDKRDEIKTLTTTKGKLEAKIGELASEITVADANIDKLVKTLATAQEDLTDATDIRKKEAEEFKVNEAELMDTIDTLKRAISIISKEMSKNPAFAQVDKTNFKSVVSALGAIVDAAAFSAAGKSKLMALVQSNQNSEAEDSEEQDPGAPESQVYKSHSGDLLELLEDLQEKAEEDLTELRKAENNAKQNFEMLKQSLEDSMKNGGKDMADEKAAKEAAEEEKANNEKDLAMTTKALAAAEKALADIKSSCMQVASDHELSVSGRNEEMKVLEESKKVLKEKTSGAVDEAYNFLQVKSRTDLKKEQVLSLVKGLAKKYHSNSLAQLASKIQAVMQLGGRSGSDPFKKVKNLIRDLIAKLEAEASAAAEEKAYCDDQMKKTEEKKSELEEDISALTAKMDKAAATSTGLKEDVKGLQAELASIAKLQAEMDKIRADNHAAYVEAKKELELGLTGVRQALTILRDYFGSKAESEALLQEGASMESVMRQPSPPVMYKKGEGAGGSIIGILEVCESDFAKNLAAVEQEEQDEQSVYDETTQANKLEMTDKAQSVKYKVQEFKSLDKALADMTADKETMNTQLKAVDEYYAKIRDRCIAKPEGYEERKRRRESEIAGLKEALTILEDDTASLLQVRTTRRSNRQTFLRA